MSPWVHNPTTDAAKTKTFSTLCGWSTTQ